MGLEMGYGGGGGRNTGYGKNSAYRTAPKITLQAKPKPAPKPVQYSAPPSTTSSGQYSGGTSSYSSGGGAPVSTPSYSQGPVSGVGRSGPSQAERRQARLAARKERRQEKRQDYREKKKEYKQFIPQDSTFQSQLSGLQAELENYITQNKSNRRDVREQFGLSRERMGDERGKALEDMEADFAARGLLNSSEYLDSVGEYNTDYQTKLGDLRRDRDSSINDLLEALGMYRRTNRGERQNARAEAVRRRAEQFGGWDPSQKPNFMR